MCVLVTNFLCGTQYLNIASFFPNFVKKSYPETITETMTAFCLTSNQLAAMLTFKIHQISISKIGRKNAVLLGLTLLSLTTVGLGMLDLISKTAWKEFYGAALAVRMTQGYANSLTVTTLYSIVSQNYKENKAVYIGYMEAACGVGLVLGPTIGSAIFSFA